MTAKKIIKTLETGSTKDIKCVLLAEKNKNISFKLTIEHLKALFLQMKQINGVDPYEIIEWALKEAIVDVKTLEEFLIEVPLDEKLNEIIKKKGVPLVSLQKNIYVSRKRSEPDIIK